MTEPLDPAPAASDAATLRRMQRQARRNTAPELALRRALHARGLRYRVDFRPIAEFRRRSDIVFSRARVAVFIDGCFWHACPEHGACPRTNAEWWREKLRRNVARDRDTDARLAVSGWTVVRVWEHENTEEAADRVAAAVTGARSGTVPSR